jgi:hypothetical protein
MGPFFTCHISFGGGKSLAKLDMRYELLAEEILDPLQNRPEELRIWAYSEDQILIWSSLLHIQVEARVNDGLPLLEGKAILLLDSTSHWVHHLDKHVVVFALNHDLGSSSVSVGKFHLNIVPITCRKAVCYLILSEIGMWRIILPAISIVIFLDVLVLEWHPLESWLE